MKLEHFESIEQIRAYYNKARYPKLNIDTELLKLEQYICKNEFIFKYNKDTFRFEATDPHDRLGSYIALCESKHLDNTQVLKIRYFTANLCNEIYLDIPF